MLGSSLNIDLLPSQKEFIYAPEKFAIAAGGYGCGKSKAGIVKGLILSSLFPGNVGWIMRFRGTDIDDSTLPLFFDTCPQDWIKSYNKKAKTVVLNNSSVIQFRHLMDASSPMKSRRAGANLGWCLIDQLEECDESHWNMMVSRIRNARIPKHFLFATMNPNGHDWIWAKTFTQFRSWPKDASGKVLPLDGKYYQTFRSKDMVATAINSEENRVSNGGFVADDVFDSMLDQYSPDIVSRMIHCSFDDYHGKLYNEYEAGLKNENFASVHNIDPFPIPNDWQLVTGIDVGGDSPWGVVPNYVDNVGNLIVVPGYHQRTARIADPARWIKNNLPFDESRSTFVIDPENKTAIVELSDLGIYCQIAQKDRLTSPLRMNGYFHVKRERPLPEWYERTQPTANWIKFRDKGSPRIFVFRTATKWREEHDTAVWDPKKPDQMRKTSTQRWDSVEAQWYVCNTRPDASKIKEVGRDYGKMEAVDPLSAREWRQYDKKLHERNWRHRGGAALKEADTLVDEGESRNPSGSYDWNAKGEM